jgi:chromosome segregation ATPase
MSAAMAEDYMEPSVLGLEPRLVRIESAVTGLDARVERVEKRVERLDDKVDALDRRVAIVEVNTENIKQNLGKVEVDVRDMRKSMEQKFESLDTELRGISRLLIGVIITFFTTLIGFGAAILGVLAKGLHWL